MTEAADTARHDFAANLRMLRAYHRLSIRDLAERAGLHPDTVSDYERERGNPRMRTIARLAAALNVDAEVLFRRVSAPSLEEES